MISAGERSQTYAIDRMATGIGNVWIYFFSVALRPNAGHGLLIRDFLDHSQLRPTVGRTLWMDDQLVAETST
jgi:hypothetical protein